MTGGTRRERELQEALDQGGSRELPPNRPKGVLGESGLNLRKEETFTPDLNAGVSQEADYPVMFLAVLLAYLLFFPLAYMILWRSKAFDTRRRIILSVIGAIGIVAFAMWLRTG